MKKLRVSLIQQDLIWENIDANLIAFESKLAQLTEQPDLVVLPEMFSTGFSMNPAAFAEKMDGPSVGWMKQQAAKYQFVLTGSLIIEENGQYYNRLIWMRPNGTYATYDKRHLFTLAGEQNYYAAGVDPLFVDLNGWKVHPLICYDLRFPVFSRNRNQYDLLIYVANWPVMRSAAWKTLLAARAIENQSYTIGVNRVGKDGNDYYHSGDSGVYDYAGSLIAQMSDVEGVFSVELDWEKQQHFRSKLQFLADQDAFELVNKTQ